jgi:putative ABC transport system substrate-binding protein
MTVFPSKSFSDNRKAAPQTAIQKRPRGPKWAGLFAIVVTITMCGEAMAQQPAKVPRIGFLAGNPFSGNADRIEAFKQSLRELGYEEGKSIVIEWRSAEGKSDRVAPLAAELVGVKVDIIVSLGPSQTPVLKKATTTIPIVMMNDPDPVGHGIVASLARPGGNITGLSTLAPDLSGKQLELLKEIVPKLSRVSVLGSSTQPGNAQTLKELKLAAEALKLQLSELDVVNSKDIETSFHSAIQQKAGAVLVLTSRIIGRHRSEVANLAAEHRLPAVYYRSDYVEAGGLMSYSTSFTDLARRAAIYVDKILKGAKPADLPVEQPKKFELVINLKSAKQIGLTIPPNVLARADRVIR